MQQTQSKSHLHCRCGDEGKCNHRDHAKLVYRNREKAVLFWEDCDQNAVIHLDGIRMLRGAASVGCCSTVLCILALSFLQPSASQRPPLDAIVGQDEGILLLGQDQLCLLPKMVILGQVEGVHEECADRALHSQEEEEGTLL